MNLSSIYMHICTICYLCTVKTMFHRYMNLWVPCNIFVWVLLHSCPTESLVHRFEPLRFNPYFLHPMTNCAVGQNRFKEDKWFKEVTISTRIWRQSCRIEDKVLDLLLVKLSLKQSSQATSYSLWASACFFFLSTNGRQKEKLQRIILRIESDIVYTCFLFHWNMWYDGNILPLLESGCQLSTHELFLSSLW